MVAIFAGLMLAGRQPTIYGDGGQTRDYVFVDDVVDAFVRATEKGGGLLMNIGTGVETSVLELYEAMAPAHRLPRAAQPRARAPGRAAAVGARPRPRRHPPRLEALDRARRRPARAPSTGSATATPEPSADGSTGASEMAASGSCTGTALPGTTDARWSARRSARATMVRVGVLAPPVGNTALPAT